MNVHMPQIDSLEALKKSVTEHSSHEWPEVVKNYTGVKDFPRFEDYSNESITCYKNI